MYDVRRRSSALILGAALLAAAGCSDSTGPSNTGGPLTADERGELAAQILTLFAQGLGSAAGVDAAFSVVPSPFSVSVNNLAVPCPEGGSTRISATTSGTVDKATQSLTATVIGTNRPTNCGLDVQGKTIFITGEFQNAASVRIENGFPVGENTASFSGDFTWRTADGRRSGSCSVNYLAKANYTTNRAEVTGELCGTSIAASGPLRS